MIDLFAPRDAWSEQVYHPLIHNIKKTQYHNGQTNNPTLFDHVVSIDNDVKVPSSMDANKCEMQIM